MRFAFVVVALTACWHSRPPEPARWKESIPISEILPDGAWLVAGVEIDTSTSTKQHEAEERARKDPDAVRDANGACQIPTSHAAFAAYGGDEFAFAVRGVFQRDAMFDCLAASYGTKGKSSHTTIAEHDVLVTQSGKERFMYVASDTGVLIMAHEPVMNRVLAQDLRPATADPRLAALVAQARAGGEIWAAARVPKNVHIINDVLSAMSVKLAGHIVALTAWIHFSEPFAIDFEIDLEQTGDAKLLADALEEKRQWLRALDKNLQPVVDPLTIRADGTHVQVLGKPAKVDWLRAFQALLSAIAVLKDSLDTH